MNLAPFIFALSSVASLALASPLVDVDPEHMATMEEDGLSFTSRLGPIAFKRLVEQLGEDVVAAKREVEDVRKSYSGKVTWFETSWLTTAGARFDLVAVVERPDRRLTLMDSCGETRLLYRLHLVDAKGDDAALPFVVNLVYEWSAEFGCAEFWRDRLAHRDDATSLAASAWSRLEVNLQTSRWADDGRGRFLDQSRYLLRAFSPMGADDLAILPLENSPDVALFREHPDMKRDLERWLRVPENRRAIEAGSYLLPESWLATKVESVTPFGLSRSGNRPFATILREGGDPAIMRRLDSLTCVGCHQSASIAGFHVLGEGRGTSDDGRLISPVSAHFSAMQPWRELWLAAAGAEGDPLPDPERTIYPDGRSAFPRENPRRDGDACEVAKLTANWRPSLDVLVTERLLTCPGGGVCATTTNGFPGGLCSTPCMSDAPGVRCRPVPVLGPFSQCRDEGGTFASCLDRHHVMTGMGACARHADCRPDYVCIGGDASDGYCAPPYVLPELSIEHH